MKARLWKGPFAGKVFDCSGQPTVVFTGPKRMSRKARYEWMQEQYRDPFSPYAYMGPTAFSKGPRVDATYRMVIRRGINGNEPWTHPDGSIFYEFVDKREY